MWSRLIEARVIQALAIYLPVGWVLTEIATAATDNFGLPDWVPGLAMTLLIAGIPVVAFLSWAFQVTDDGIRTEVRSLKGGIAITVAVSLLLGIGSVLFQRLQVQPEMAASPTAPEVAPETEVAKRTGPPMVAVLPFTFVAAQADASFFAAGVHDDLLTQLARLSGMRVISRTSVLQYANTTIPIPKIGTELGADAILEGGIQMYGNQIRINAQLLNAATDEHLWAETFDRELTPESLFDVQAEIARAIAQAMQATLTLSEASRLDVIPTTNMAAYRLYHEAMTQLRSVGQNRDEVRQLLRQAVDLDPRFVRAAAELVGIMSIQNFSFPDSEDIANIERLLETIRETAPNSPEYLFAQSYYTYYIVRDYEAADRLISLARELAPSDTRLIEVQSWIKRRRDEMESYVALTRTAMELEPKNPEWPKLLSSRLGIMHRFDEALAVASKIENPDPVTQQLIAMLELKQHKSLRRYRNELEQLYRKLDPSTDPAAQVRFALWEAHLAVRDVAAAEEIILQAEADLADSGVESFGAYNAMLNALMHYIAVGDDTGRKQATNRIRRMHEAQGVESFEDMYVLPRLLILIAEDNRPKAREAILELREIMRTDVANRIGYSDILCSALAMTDRALEAVDCLRDAMARPSSVRIFIEPLLPYYDRIRDTPEFQLFLEDLVEQGWIDPASRSI